MPFATGPVLMYVGACSAASLAPPAPSTTALFLLP
jgi:hypothetical protein